MIKPEGLADMKEPIMFSHVDEDGASITLNYGVTGYDVYLRLSKKDENHVTGTQLDMFEVSGERVMEQEHFCFYDIVNCSV